MKWPILLFSAAISGCASNGYEIDSQHQSFLEMTEPGLTGCKSIQTEYKALSKAPAELVADKDSYIPPQKLVQVWVMAGCKDNERIKLDIVADGRGGAVAMPIKY